MAKIFFDTDLPETANGEIAWSAKNGATRRELKLVNKLGRDIPSQTKCLEASVGTLDKGNHAFIFLNEPKASDSRVLGIALNSAYAYTVVEGKELYTNTSSGGYGNSCSQFGVYELGVVLKHHSYKNRRGATYVRLTENGWVRVEAHEYEADEQTEL